MADAPKTIRPAVGAIVVTALEEERAAFLGVLDDVEVTRHGGRDLHTASLGGVRIAVESLHGMGNAGAALTVGVLLSFWQAQKVFLVGIAGGFHSAGVRAGDLLVADQIVGYESAKLRPDGAQRRPEVYRPDFDLLTAARDVRPEEWAERVRATRPDPGGVPAVQVGTVLSGEKVIADEAVLDELRADWPKAVGVEMESLGVALAAYRADGRFLMTKGVSDLADAAKDERWRAYAAEAAAWFAVAVLRRLPVPSLPQTTDLSVPGPLMLSICWRLVDDWLKLAHYFEIPAYDRAAFRPGDEPAQVWQWLAARRRLRELPRALTFIGRSDLAEELLREA